MRVELALFLREQQHFHEDYFENSQLILISAYMTDIFDALNHLNQQIQVGGVNIIEVEENLTVFGKTNFFGNDEQRMINWRMGNWRKQLPRT